MHFGESHTRGDEEASMATAMTAIDELEQRFADRAPPIGAAWRERDPFSNRAVHVADRALERGGW